MKELIDLGELPGHILPKTDWHNWIDKDEKVRLLEVTCRLVESYEEPKISHIIDDDGDPEFFCCHCEAEYNHTRIGKQDKYHTVRLIGEVTIDELRRFMERRGADQDEDDEISKL